MSSDDAISQHPRWQLRVDRASGEELRSCKEKEKCKH